MLFAKVLQKSVRGPNQNIILYHSQFTRHMRHDTHKRTLTPSYLEQISVQDLETAARAHVLPGGRHGGGGGRGRADGRS